MILRGIPVGDGRDSSGMPMLNSVPALDPLTAPPADAFPLYPTSWYLFGDVRDLRRGLLSRPFLGGRLVAFRTAGGRFAVLDARCAHLRADLGNGRVVGETVQCPYHNWRYASDGRCVHIPAAADIPAFARQRSYPTEERHGLLFFFNGPRPLYPLPFFPDEEPANFVRARPFGAALDCPWYLVGANACDVQHFLGAHDRRLAGPHSLEHAHPFARRASAPFAVVGTSLRDRLTRWFSGDEVRLTVTDWGGTMLLVTAKFRRTTSYGMLTSSPLGRGRVLVRGVVFVRRGRGRLAGLLGGVNLAIRRYFIKEFLRFDAELAMKGIRYNPDGLLPCDGELVRYWRWLADVSARASAEGWGGAPASCG
jgi:nitrite reductase/ring-hydroxylating ferredoxin subunit